MRSNIYLASERQRPEQHDILKAKFEDLGKVWPRPRDAKMAQMPDVYHVSWGSLKDEVKVRGDVDRALSLGISVLQYDWEPTIDVIHNGNTIKVPPTSYIHLPYEKQAEADDKWQQQLIQAGEWIHDQSGAVEWGVYDLPTTFGDGNLAIPAEVDSVNYNIERCTTRRTSFGRVGPGCLASVDYLCPTMYRPHNFNLGTNPDWLFRVDVMQDILDKDVAERRIICWAWPRQHPGPGYPPPEWPVDEWAVMLAKLLEMVGLDGAVMIHCEGYDTLETSNPIWAEVWNQWNRCTA